ncbi:MAG: carboxypeptidase-like regulatory domain-containing protein [Gemmatimonadota bacterium]|nr:carboxypeptidase-like regulatory domain-containing protein [Gemmatimonadota bacterium]MDQ8148153.1 carboxypeptidase-like regulatory domain-containing protein [Gemmatimonadota bacterium]
MSLLAVLITRDVGAQLVRGTVRSVTTARGIPDAEVNLRDTAGVVVASARSDAEGHWRIELIRPVGPLRLEARRVGFARVAADAAPLSPGDTIEVEFQLTELASLDEVRVTGMATLNEQRLADAQRRGWRVYAPELVAEYRDRASDFLQLLRIIGTPSLYVPRRSEECVRSSRNNRCLTYIVDGQVMGQTIFVLPNDVHFFAILQAAESRATYGNRAPDGAIAIFTRSFGDRVAPPPR